MLSNSALLSANYRNRVGLWMQTLRTHALTQLLITMQRVPLSSIIRFCYFL